MIEQLALPPTNDEWSTKMKVTDNKWPDGDSRTKELSGEGKGV